MSNIATVTFNAGNSNRPASNLNSSPEEFLRELSNENTAKTFSFNSTEAEKSRDWSEYMSNTSHQREVDDLIRAGLNPVLSANSGAQSYSAASASGTADNSAVGVLASIYNQKMSNANALKIAEMNNKNSKEIAKINAAASMYASDTASSASKYSADKSKYGLIDNFVNGLIGNNNGSSSSKIGNAVKNVVKWTYGEYSKPRQR